MLGIWLMEILTGIGKLFLNPLFYWIIVLLALMGWRRIKKERRQFGTKIYPFFTECQGTMFISIVFSIIISLVAILVGMVMSFEAIVLFVIVTIIVSMTGRTSLLSASYTLGITFVLLLLLPYVNIGPLEAYVNFQDVTIIQLLTLTLLMSLLLFAEALLVSTKKGATFPEIELGSRGKWIGQHRIKRAVFIPFFVLLPVGQADLVLPVFPYFEVAGTGYSLILLPFIIGTNYTVRGELPVQAIKKLGLATWLVSVIVLLITLVSFYFPYVSIIAFLVAIIGKEWITYHFKKKDKYKRAIFTPLDEGVKVLALLPGSPAHRLEIKVGETIKKVNGQPIKTVNAFYEALQNSGAFFKLDIIDLQGEVRFIHSALYEEDHHELGVIFVESQSKYEDIE